MPRLTTILKALLLAALLGSAATLIVRAAPEDALRAADRQFYAGQYHAALQSYARLSVDPQQPLAALRLGIVRFMRGEHAPAERALRRALQSDLRPRERELASLYLAATLEAQGKAEAAAQLYTRLQSCGADCFFAGEREVLAAELALRQNSYAAAEAAFRQALALQPPSGWHQVALTRLALLESARDPEVAHTTLTTQRAPSTRGEPFLHALLPTQVPDPAQLAAALAEAPTQRLRLLGQYFLEMHLYSLAEAQFAQVAPESPDALGAAAYAAYARWRAGDHKGGIERLETLVAEYPDEPRARTLLALAYVAADDSKAARAQIETIVELSPARPDAYLAWASWHVAQRDYVAAAQEYQRALLAAAPAERGRYALLAADFHLNLGYKLCEEGLPHAEEAARLQPANSEAWSVLAAQRYHCADFAGAVAAARSALALNEDARSSYYLGAGLAALGQRSQARALLVHAADLAPASIWRERAELALARLPEN
jgi:tetratricopeptide (TPR) repeat protein